MNSSETKSNSSLAIFLSVADKIDWKKIPETQFINLMRYERPADKISWTSLSINPTYSNSRTRALNKIGG